MTNEVKVMGSKRFSKSFIWLVNCAGAILCLFSAYYLPAGKIDVHFLLLASVTVVISSRVAVQLPRINTNVTVADTFIFLAMLLYSGEAAILLAAAEGLFSGLRISRTPRIVLFAASSVACATFVTSLMLTAVFGADLSLLPQDLSNLFIAICLMALAQYVAHTGIVAIGTALKNEQPIWQTWSKHYFWASITYFVGAVAAGVIASVVGTMGFYALLITIPIIFIVYLTYHKYLEDIKVTARQAELAERARAEAERERAEQAEQHVEELSHYVAELESTSKALQESREHFRHAAFHDSLTGLPNRALFTDHLRRAVERAKRSDDYQFAVLFLDLDRFKNINDSLGHSYGDQLLIVTARRLEASLRQVDTVARFGGDEFAILLDGLKEASDAIRIAEKIQQELVLPFNLDKHEAFTTASIGIALSTTCYERSEDILRDADTAMYRAKEGGKARHEVFDKVMHARAMSLLRLENDLRRAIERQEFRVHYQPLVALETGKLFGFEALARWQHPERGLVSPAEFIPVAEETGLIVSIGQWVLEEACRQMCEWQQESTANRMLTLSVNISGRQLNQPNLIEEVEEVLRKTGLDPKCLKLEITESVVMENAEAATSLLMKLRALGVQLSIDDFGTGYSSLSYLHRFPLNTLKIDRSFVSRMSLGDENLEIVRTIVTLARNLGMEVVAEGVETIDQMAQLTALGCEYGQGYLFSKPLQADAIGLLIQNERRGQSIVPRLPETSQQDEPDLLNSTLVM